MAHISQVYEHEGMVLDDKILIFNCEYADTLICVQIYMFIVYTSSFLNTKIYIKKIGIPFICIAKGHEKTNWSPKLEWNEKNDA